MVDVSSASWRGEDSTTGHRVTSWHQQQSASMASDYSALENNLYQMNIVTLCHTTATNSYSIWKGLCVINQYNAGHGCEVRSSCKGKIRSLHFMQNRLWELTLHMTLKYRTFQICHFSKQFRFYFTIMRYFVLVHHITSNRKTSKFLFVTW